VTDSVFQERIDNIKKHVGVKRNITVKLKNVSFQNTSIKTMGVKVFCVVDSDPLPPLPIWGEDDESVILQFGIEDTLMGLYFSRETVFMLGR